MGPTSESDAFGLFEGAVVHADGDMGCILHHQLDGHRAGSSVCVVLRLASDIFVMMRLLDGQFQGRGGRNPLGIFNRLRVGLLYAFGNGTAIAVQPSEL